MDDILIIFWNGNERRAGFLQKEYFEKRVFPIFRDHLVPLTDEDIHDLKNEGKL